MKKLMALCFLLSACAGTSHDAREPSSVAPGSKKVSVRCGRGGESTPAIVYLPALRDCVVTNRKRLDENYFKVDCSAHPITFTSEGRTYVSATPRKDLIFFGVCGKGGANCGSLDGVNLNSLELQHGKNSKMLRGVPELHTLKSSDGLSMKLIVGRSRDGQQLTAKGVFRGCTIE